MIETILIPSSIPQQTPSLYHILSIADLAKIVETYVCSDSRNKVRNSRFPLNQRTSSAQHWIICRQLSKRICECVDNNLEELTLILYLSRHVSTTEALTQNLRATLSLRCTRTTDKNVKEYSRYELSLQRLFSKVVNAKGIWLDCRVDGVTVCLFSISSERAKLPEKKSEATPLLASLSGVRSKETAIISWLLCNQCIILSLVNQADVQLSLEVLESCAPLYSLNLSDCQSIINVSRLKSCTSLNTLNLRGCLRLSDVRALRDFTSLHTLNLSKRIRIRNVSPLCGCASLHTLNLSWNNNLWDVYGLVCVSLHTLDLSRCSNLRDINALKYCASLHTLILSYCLRFTNVNVLGECASLHTLDLSACFYLRDVSGLGNCASLHTLNLTGCSSLSEVNGFGKSASLHTLDLGGCSSLSDVNALSHCMSLHSLEFTECNYIKDVSVLKNCTSLHTLDIRGCTSLSSGSGNCVSLHSFDYGSCVSLKDVNALSNCASLHTLKLWGLQKLEDVGDWENVHHFILLILEVVQLLLM